MIYPSIAIFRRHASILLRTQAALLEAMEEKQVTVDGTAHALKNPFIAHGDPCDSMQQEKASDSNGSETEDGEGSAHRSITRGRH